MVNTNCKKIRFCHLIVTEITTYAHLSKTNYRKQPNSFLKYFLNLIKKIPPKNILVIPGLRGTSPKPKNRTLSGIYSTVVSAAKTMFPENMSDPMKPT